MSRFEKGDLVQVIKGKKVQRGIIGEVFWFGTPRRKGWNTPMGIDVNGRQYWTSVEDCRMILPLATMDMVKEEDIKATMEQSVADSESLLKRFDLVEKAEEEEVVAEKLGPDFDPITGTTYIDFEVGVKEVVVSAPRGWSKVYTINNGVGEPEPERTVDVLGTGRRKFRDEEVS